MLTRRAFAFALAGAAVAAAPGCASVPRNPAPSLRFGDFRLAGREIELRVFADGAGVLVNGSLSTGGMIESRTMERLRALIASPEFNDQLTRPLDDVETKVCGDLASFRETFRMGGLAVDVPCTTSDRPTLAELRELLEPYRRDGFREPLPDGRPDLPRITVRWGRDTAEPRIRLDLRPDGTVVQSTEGSGDPVTRTLDLAAPERDAIRLILRTGLCAPPEPPADEPVLRIQVADGDPVAVSQSPIDKSDCLDLHAIAQLVIRAR